MSRELPELLRDDQRDFVARDGWVMHVRRADLFASFPTKAQLGSMAYRIAFDSTPPLKGFVNLPNWLFIHFRSSIPRLTSVVKRPVPSPSREASKPADRFPRGSSAASHATHCPNVPRVEQREPTKIMREDRKRCVSTIVE